MDRPDLAKQLPLIKTGRLKWLFVVENLLFMYFLTYKSNLWAFQKVLFGHVCMCSKVLHKTDEDSISSYGKYVVHPSCPVQSVPPVNRWQTISSRGTWCWWNAVPTDRINSGWQTSICSCLYLYTFTQFQSHLPVASVFPGATGRQMVMMGPGPIAKVLSDRRGSGWKFVPGILSVLEGGAIPERRAPLMTSHFFHFIPEPRTGCRKRWWQCGARTISSV